MRFYYYNFIITSADDIRCGKPSAVKVARWVWEGAGTLVLAYFTMMLLS